MSIRPVTIGQLKYFAAEGISAPHCFTTRLSGVSRGSLTSMNIGLNRGDDPACVRKNLEILGSAVGFSPDTLVACKQTHSDIVHRVGKAHTGCFFTEGASPEGDALITDEPGVALVVFTADCTPVLLHDPATGAVGATHAGWRGSALGIVKKTVEAMVREYGCAPQNIHAAVGPSIGQCCFETDADVPDAILQALGEDAAVHIQKFGRKYYVNLKEVNALWLKKAGITHIEISPLCTACRQDLFWSHRRMGLQRGSQGAIIVCKEVQP